MKQGRRDLEAAERREKYEKRIRELATERNQKISQAKSDYEAAIKAARREILPSQ